MRSTRSPPRTTATAEPEPLAAYARFLRDRGRDDEACQAEERIAELLEPEGAAGII